jgi:hypothetical protein
MESPHLDTFVLSAVKTGLAAMESSDSGLWITASRALTDLMFSCRIQSKRVEHAFLRAMARE